MKGTKPRSSRIKGPVMRIERGLLPFMGRANGGDNHWFGRCMLEG